MWRRLYPEGDGSGGGSSRPIFVGFAGGVAVGRVRPDPALNWDPGRVEVPEWMWLLLGAPDSGAVFDMDPVEIHDVGHLVLRPRSQIVEDPVARLTAELSNGRWACLHAGMELTLDCGVWDVIRVVDLVGTEVPVGCILNQDVTVELDVAAHHQTSHTDASSLTTPVQTPQSQRVSSPPPSPPAILLPSDGMIMSFPGMMDIRHNSVSGGGRRGYIPFGGAGHRLG